VNGFDLALIRIRQYDYPSSVLQPFIPHHARDAYLALRAFNIDVARVADTTSHPAVGAVRMQFWRDTVTSSLAGIPRKEPAAILLAHAAETLHHLSDGTAKLSKNWLFRIIGTREQNLGNPPYPTLAALETYAESTYSTLLYLTLQALPMNSLTADHLASHIGKATGIVTILRGLPLVAFPPPPPTHHPSNAKGGAMTAGPQGAVLLPLDIMAKTGVQEERVLREGSAAPGLRDAVFEVATRASDHLITAREMLKNLRGGLDVGHDFEHLSDDEHSYTAQGLASGTEKQLQEVDNAFGVLMGPAVATSMWLDQLQRVDFDVFDHSLRRTDWKLPWKAYWAFKKRKF
jgi:NADH dehydrogenase [ubiquinone] 1 alpha subcomplex assembly factor 6